MPTTRPRMPWLRIQSAMVSDENIGSNPVSGLPRSSSGLRPKGLAEASVAQAALRRHHDTFDGSAIAVSERLRKAVWQKAFAEGAE